jgi:hypothetical protein
LTGGKQKAQVGWVEERNPAYLKPMSITLWSWVAQSIDFYSLVGSHGFIGL